MQWQLVRFLNCFAGLWSAKRIAVAYFFPVILTMTYICHSEDAPVSAASAEWVMIVTDPLAAPLSCPCVQGYAQRDYEALAEHLRSETGRRIELHFAESPALGLRTKTAGKADLVIGKESVIAAAAKELKLPLRPVARLSGKDGSTTQTGLVVVRADDPARTIDDIRGYRILFGSADADEKHAAVLAMLDAHGVPHPDQLETSAACSDGACKIIEWGQETRAAAVISSYAKPLLEGCGTIEKGDLRVIAETPPVPFITAFINTELPIADQEAILKGLHAVIGDRELRVALETLTGFVDLGDEALDGPQGAGAQDTVSAKKK
jgi:ABC-type phosphate/phosphonate transport system substrate-binding protein